MPVIFCVCAGVNGQVVTGFEPAAAAIALCGHSSVNHAIPPLTPRMWTVRFVGDAAAAVRASREQEPDVVVLDYRLPDVDGATVATELTTPVVFLSASAGRDEYDAASSAGAPLVRKDEGIDALLAAIRAAAGR